MKGIWSRLGENEKQTVYKGLCQEKFRSIFQVFGSSIGSKYEARWDRSRLGENGRQNGNVVMSIRHKIAKGES